MKHLETRFRKKGDLIVLRAEIRGPRGTLRTGLALDTASEMTTLTHKTAESIGYGPRDGLRLAVPSLLYAQEEGYVLRLPYLHTLRLSVQDLEVNVFDLGYPGIGGALGMNFLRELNFEVRSLEKKIIVESYVH